MTTTLHEQSGLPGGAGNGRWPEPPGFLSAYSGYRSTALLDRLRATEYFYLDAAGHADRGRVGKRDPRRQKNQTQIEGVVALTWAASQGDLDEVRALIAAGVEPGTADYDGRTPLHLAAAEGQLDVVRYLLAAGVRPQPADRWGGTPLSDAEGNDHTHVAELIRQAAQPAERKVAI